MKIIDALIKNKFYFTPFDAVLSMKYGKCGYKHNRDTIIVEVKHEHFRIVICTTNHHIDYKAKELTIDTINTLLTICNWKGDLLHE